MTLKDKIIEHIKKSIESGSCYGKVMCKLVNNNCRVCVLSFGESRETYHICVREWKIFNKKRTQKAIKQLKEIPDRYFTKSGFSRTKFESIYKELIKQK